MVLDDKEEIIANIRLWHFAMLCACCQLDWLTIRSKIGDFLRKIEKPSVEKSDHEPCTYIHLEGASQDDILICHKIVNLLFSLHRELKGTDLSNYCPDSVSALLNLALILSLRYVPTNALQQQISAFLEKRHFEMS